MMSEGFKGVQNGVDRSNTILGSTSPNITTLVNSLPAIFEQLAIIDGQLRSISSHIGNTSEIAISSSTLGQHLENTLQNIMVWFQPPSSLLLTKALLINPLVVKSIQPSLPLHSEFHHLDALPFPFYSEQNLPFHSTNHPRP